MDSFEETSDIVTGLAEGLIADIYPERGCPLGCGCDFTKRDCEQKYTIEAIQTSANAKLSPIAQRRLNGFLEMQHKKAMQQCGKTHTELGSTDSGGW